MSKQLRDDISIEQITEMYRKEKDGRLKERLLTIKLICEGKKAAEISREIGVSKKTIYNWVDLWNAEGYEGLKTKHDRAGRKGYLSKQEWEEVFNEIAGKGYTVQDVLEYVKTTRGENYTYKGIWKILSRKFNIKPPN